MDAYKRKEGKNPAKRSRRIEITDHIWATRFAPYFPDINPSNTSPSEKDREFADLISTFIEKRNDQLDKLNELLEKLNYMIYLLEEQQNEKTGHVTEEVILYSFLGVFIIFVVDSFARVGKYVR